MLFAGIGSELACTALHLSPWLVGAAWVLAGAGMGLMFPRISAYVLAASGAREQGGNSAAMSIADAVGGATAISLAGLLFTAVGTAADLAAFVAALAFTTVLAGGAVLVARRTGTAPVSRAGRYDTLGKSTADARQPDTFLTWTRSGTRTPPAPASAHPSSPVVTASSGSSR